MITEVITAFDDILYTWCLIYLLAGAGIFFTIRTGFVQIRLFGDSLRCMLEKKSTDKGVSSFQALMIATASRVGTGNMAGVATAIVVGGPGAAFWMWLMAVLGAASAFAESTLAQIYKEKDGDTFKGGPAYYIEKALNARWLGILFAISLIATFAFGFNGLQAFNIVSAFQYYTVDFAASRIPLIVGILLAVISLVLFFGGTDRISWVSSVLVLPYFRKAFTDGEYWYMAVMAFSMIGRAIGGMIHYRVKIPARYRFYTALTVYIVISLCEGVYLFFSIPVMMALCFTIGIGGVTSYTIRISATQSYVPDEKKGRFNGAFNMLSTVGALLGELAAGTLTAFFPERMILLFSMLLCALAAVVFIGGNREHVSAIYNRVE